MELARRKTGYPADGKTRQRHSGCAGQRNGWWDIEARKCTQIGVGNYQTFDFQSVVKKLVQSSTSRVEGMPDQKEVQRKSDPKVGKKTGLIHPEETGRLDGQNFDKRSGRSKERNIDQQTLESYLAQVNREELL